MLATRDSYLASVLLILNVSFTLDVTEVDELRKSDSWGIMRIPTGEVENRGMDLGEFPISDNPPTIPFGIGWDHKL